MMRRYGIDSTLLVANQHRGDDRDRRVGRGRQRSAPPRSAASPPIFPYCSSPARRRRARARRASTTRERTSRRRVPPCARIAYSASTTSTSQSSPSGSGAGRTPKPPSRRSGAGTPAAGRSAARLVLCAKGLRAHAELAALARARRDADAVHAWLARGAELIAVARRGAEEASAVTPNAGRLARPGRGGVRACARRACGRSSGPRRRRRGSSSSARRSPPTAAGVRPRRSSPPAHHAPRRASP